MYKPMRILIVEDDPSAACIFQHWLRSANHRVEVEHTAEAALARLRSGQQWDLILADIELPGRSGLDLVKQIHLSHPHLPVLLITGHRSTEIASAAMASGAVGFLLKPFDRYSLLERVDGVAQWQSQTLRILAIGAHPDDVEVGCGGTLLTHSQAGHQVMILPLIRGTPYSASSMLEAANAAQILGAHLHTAPLLEPREASLLRLTALLSEVIQQFQPTWVYTHSVNDFHPEHRLTYSATMTAAREVPNVLCYQSPSSTPAFRPTRFVDIQEQLTDKQIALNAYLSQFAARHYLKPDQVAATASYWGRFSSCRLVEAFQVVRSEEDLDQSPTTIHYPAQ